MNINITRQNIATTLTITLSLSVLLFLKANPVTTINASGQLPIARGLDSFFASLSLTAQTIITSLALMVIAWKSIIIVARYSVLKGKTYIPATITTIYCLYLFDFKHISILLAIYFLMCFIQSLLSSSNHINGYGRMLDTYVYLGLAIMLCSPMITYALLWPVGMTFVSRDWRHWLCSLLGMVAPIAIHIYISHFFLGAPLGSIIDQHSQLLASPALPLADYIRGFNFSDYQAIATLIFYLSSAVLFALAIVSSYRGSENMRTRQYKSFRITNYLSILAVFTILFCNNGARYLGLLAVPLSIILPSFFSYNRSKAANILYFLLLASLTASLILR